MNMTGDGGTKVFFSATCKTIETGRRVSTLARRKRFTRVRERQSERLLKEGEGKRTRGSEERRAGGAREKPTKKERDKE